MTCAGSEARVGQARVGQTSSAHPAGACSTMGGRLNMLDLPLIQPQALETPCHCVHYVSLLTLPVPVQAAKQAETAPLSREGTGSGLLAAVTERLHASLGSPRSGTHKASDAAVAAAGESLDGEPK